MSILNDTILIEIAAYKESELLNTVHSALLQADNPDRIHFGICYQYDKLDDYNELLKIKNCKVIYFKESEAKGLCFARNHCQHLIADEKYILQIDAHMRFVKHWDTGMIKQLLGTKDKRAIISFYPTNCNGEMMTLPLDDPKFDTPTNACMLCASKFNDYPSYFIKYSSYPITNHDNKYRRNPFISGGNFFSYSKVHKEVYNDPNMFFYGDELPMAIRLFTNGWNVYTPSESYIYHQYERKNQSFPKITNQMVNEYKRFSCLLGITSGIDFFEYGLGKKRTLKEFEKFSGINFRNRTISTFTKKGTYEEKRSNIYPVKKYKKDLTTILQEREKIYVVIVDLFEKYMDCIDSCYRNSANKDNIYFIVGTRGRNVSSLIMKKYNIKSITSFGINDSYSEILSKLMKNVTDGTIAIVDSSYKFFGGWDEYYSTQLNLCGEKSVLTSWIWYAKSQKVLDNLHSYKNLVFEFSHFEDYLPALKYNDKIKLSERAYPYQVAFNPNGFYFGHFDIFKEVLFDPSLNFKEQNIIYSLRLFTHGINMYMPPLSYFVRTIPEDLMCTSKKNYPVICGLFNNDQYYSRELPANYLYGLGKERAIWDFFDFIHIDYS